MVKIVNSLNLLQYTGPDWDGGPLSRKFANGSQVILPGQGHFIKRILPWVYFLQCERGIGKEH